MALIKKQAQESFPIDEERFSLERVLGNSFRDSLTKEEFAYRTYIGKKLKAAEEDIRNGRTIPHAKMLREVRKWFKSGGPKKRLKT